VAPGPDVLVVVATKAARADDADRWLDRLTSIVADAGAMLWQLDDLKPIDRPGPGHSHVITFGSKASPAGYDRAVRAARADGDLPVTHTEIRRDVWTRHGSPSPVAPGPDATGLIAAEVLCSDPDPHSEWDDWYDRQHLPYEISGQSVEEAIRCSTEAVRALIAEGRRHPCHAGGLTLALTRVC
jgi:hypothetical protein